MAAAVAAAAREQTGRCRQEFSDKYFTRRAEHVLGHLVPDRTLPWESVQVTCSRQNTMFCGCFCSSSPVGILICPTCEMFPVGMIYVYIYDHEDIDEMSAATAVEVHISPRIFRESTLVLAFGNLLLPGK